MSGILHLGFNGNFQENSFKLFERYYPGQNIMLASSPKDGEVKKINLSPEKLKWVDYHDVKCYPDLLAWVKSHNVNRVLMHSAFYGNVRFAAFLKEHIQCKIYWLFWGFELYNALGEDLGVSYVDEKVSILKPRTFGYPSRIKHYLRKIKYGINYIDVLKDVKEIADYFCFWNKYDYDLYVKYFGDKVKYKFFAYSSRFRDNDIQESYVFPEKAQIVIINHQASATGNHITLIKKMREIDPEREFSVCMPLSYGSRSIRKYCLRVGKQVFKSAFHPILTYMPREEYFNVIGKAQVALFGQKRQEASGNISRLLTLGTKVFLREENPLLKYYRDKGYIIYSFEKDLKQISDLSPLTEKQKIHNKKTWYRTCSYYDDFMPLFFND